MNEAFDPLNIVILVVAVIIFLKLRSVLGRRTGQEREHPFETFGMQDRDEKEKREGNVVPLPNRDDEEIPESAYRMRHEEEEPIWQDIAEEGTPLANALVEIKNVDEDFMPKEFLQGAKSAYEMIVTAFADGDRKVLKNLLSAEVYEGFNSALTEREKAGHVQDATFVGIDKVSIIDGSLKDKNANVTIKFVSQLISVTRDKSSAIIEGDPQKIREVTDIWTFMRDITSRDPNWKLVATEAAN
ncbi:MAG: Tim44/TimA family putative adaptor protein [Hyphomicrobiales bacterium]